MTIKVAYDISILGYYFHRFDCKTGIFRVIEEVLTELIKFDDLDITLVGLCGDDPMTASLRSYFYAQSQKEDVEYKFASTFASRLGLTNLYKNLFNIYFSENFQKLPKISARSVLVRGGLRLLSYAQHLDVHRTFDNKSFDLLHSPYLQLPPTSLTSDIPRLLTIYDLIPVLTPEWVVPELVTSFQRILASISKERDWITCISEYTKQEFCEYTGMPPDRVFVTPLAAAKHFYPVKDKQFIKLVKQKYNILEGKYFLSLAALQPRKNLTHLIKAFFNLLQEQPNIDTNLVLVGSKGWMYEEIFAVASSSDRFRSRVIFTGYVPDQDLSAIYSGATAFVYPSLYEGFGLPPLEAMQCGVPVITSNTTSLPEVVGDAGITIEPRDEDALCQAMLNVLTDSPLCQQLSQKGLERAKQFSWKKCAEETMEIYKRAISDSSKV